MNFSSYNSHEFGRVALLMGGWSAERDISLKSGNAVLAALRRLNIDVTPIDAGRDVYDVLRNGNFDRVFNMLHGRGGEDGVIQSLLELLELPYTGSGVLGSAVAMDKLRSKYLWRGQGLPTPEFVVLEQTTDCETALAKLGLPLIVKPVLEGSSVGIGKVKQAGDMQPAWELARKYGPVIAEKWITGGEYTVGILGGQTLPLIRLETPREFYDYQAKYLDNQTRYHCPCGLPAQLEQNLQELARRAFVALGAEGWGRVDLMLDEAQQPWLIEANTIPGMTDHSLVPMAAKAAGIGFDELVLRILCTSMPAAGAHDGAA
jgi:D-alanine-D-alanine ligase